VYSSFLSSVVVSSAVVCSVVIVAIVMAIAIVCGCGCRRDKGNKIGDTIRHSGDSISRGERATMAMAREIHQNNMVIL